MLKRQFNFQRQLRAVVYLRVSDDSQNARSPDQQLAEIKRRLKALGYPWTILRIYRDEFISGRLVRKRAGFQKMLRDIKSGELAVDVVLVDTTERLGRYTELPLTVHRLREESGVLVLAASNNFADPTTPQGRLMELFETMRASEENRIKAHQVLRGKLDMIEQGKWPGGKAPFGLRLKCVMKTVDCREELDYHTIEPQPSSRWIIERLFRQALNTSWGAVRLTKEFNSDPEVPAYLKPLSFTTVGRWLSNPLYVGDLIWNVHSTGIVNDVRVKEKNPSHEVLHIEDFCEAIIPREMWNAVQALRHARAKLIRESRGGASEGEIQPHARGLIVKYPLSGLVFCECGRRMVASSTSTYITMAGHERRYAAYICPTCRNTPGGSPRVSEEWLRGVVLARLLDRLFGEIIKC